MITLLKRQWFVIGLSAAVLLAFKIPEWGASGGKLQSDVASEIGIILVFLFQGWMLPTEILTKCMLRWKVHLFIQLFVFGMFPLLIIFGDLVWSAYMPEPLRTGFFFLAVLPTTITSAIIYTSQSGGNTAISMANTTLANLAGVLITPLWMTFLISSGGGEIGELETVFLKLTKLILLPFFVGQMAHLFWKSALPFIKFPVGILNQAIIIFIVFAAFSNSVVGGVWQGQGASLVILTTLVGLVIFFVVLGVCMWGIQLLKFSIEDHSAIFFCSTQKTLAAAVPLGISLFGTDPKFGIILLPVLIYHPIELILGACLFGRFRKQIAASVEA